MSAYRSKGLVSGFKIGDEEFARADITAKEGGRSIGEDEMVLVMSERRTFVSGNTANGAG